MRFWIFLPCLLAVALLTGCESPRYVYHYIPGKTATLENGQATAPPKAPERVQAAIAAANRIAGSAYQYGGGHGRPGDVGLDCSGATSYVLREAGLMTDSMPSSGFRHYGERGAGDWISIYARHGHVFLVLAGLRFDTGWGDADEGPNWSTRSRPADGCVIRHPAEL